MSMFSLVYIQEHMSRDLYPLIFQGLRIICIVPAHQKIFCIFIHFHYKAISDDSDFRFRAGLILPIQSELMNPGHQIYGCPGFFLCLCFAYVVQFVTSTALLLQGCGRLRGGD